MGSAVAEWCKALLVRENKQKSKRSRVRPPTWAPFKKNLWPSSLTSTAFRLNFSTDIISLKALPISFNAAIFLSFCCVRQLEIYSYQATFLATLNDWNPTKRVIKMIRFSICSTNSTINIDHLTDQCFWVVDDSLLSAFSRSTGLIQI